MFINAATQWEYFENPLKFYVDEAKKYIMIGPDVTDLDIKLDIYKGLKTWYAIYDNSRFSFPIRSIGGDTIPGSQFAGDLYFMINNYRLVYDPTKVKVTGIVYSDNFDTPWLFSGNLSPVYPATVSNLALGVAPDLTALNIPTAIETADAVWDTTTDSALINTYGEKMLKLLTVAKYLGLK